METCCHLMAHIQRIAILRFDKSSKLTNKQKSKHILLIQSWVGNLRSSGINPIFQVGTDHHDLRLSCVSPELPFTNAGPYKFATMHCNSVQTAAQYIMLLSAWPVQDASSAAREKTRYDTTRQQSCSYTDNDESGLGQQVSDFCSGPEPLRTARQHTHDSG